MALPVLAGAAGATALSAYLNAKFHVAHDIKTGRGGLAPLQSDFEWLGSRAAQQKPLLYHMLQEHARTQYHHPFIIFEGQEWSYGLFFDALTRVGNWLIDELGIEKGEVVAIDGGNSPEYMMLWFAIDAIGAATSFVNWNLTGDGLVHCVKLCDSRYLITDSDVRDNVEPVRSELEENKCTIKYYDSSFFSSLSNTKPIPESRNSDIALDSIRNLIYTSGTTGLPKGVVGTTGREILVSRLVSRYLNLKPSDRMYTCMPLYHGAAHALCTTASIYAGSTVVLGRKFSHRTFWPEVSAGKATIIQYVGELCRYLLNGPPNEYERKHNVKMAWGNGMRPDVWEPFRERFNIPVINELYAATDGLGATFNYNAGPFTAHTLGLRGAIWNWRFGEEEVRVKMDVDTEDIMRDKDGWAVRCGVNEPGQVLHRLTPEMVARVPGYYNNEKATEGRRIKDVFKKGDHWFKSGDMMRQDADGRVYFVDRLGDTFRWKSENVSTNEVADMVGKFPQVAETNVYGVSIPGYDGRAGAASIVMADGVTEAGFDFKALADHARAVLPGYAVPLFLRVTPALEYTGTLKIQKGRLKREGVDPDLVTGGDKIYWLSGDTYKPFEREDWEAIKSKKVRLT
ncbi:long-chain fatty acid transporter-like protein [Massarina eburnea CBS 473.64]|uniref:Very long-chain fatty acid transport protein n=1 Tax=Massarina eburnea CBS 473.64 TaxID=1395130 RepID=A0A6A6RP47_9PLEO|nr:long-chain fatty acid transporter-like protein [Massarina eburnea CBS 473.64]